MGRKPVYELDKGSNTEIVTRETVMQQYTAEQMEEMAQEMRRQALPQLLLDVKALIHERGLTFHQLVKHALEVGALTGFAESEATGYTKPVYINPDNPDEIYKGSGPKPDWYARLMEAGHHQYEFRSDKPLRGRIWRNPEEPEETWEGVGKMPKWLYDDMFYPNAGRKPRDYILRIAEEKE